VVSKTTCKLLEIPRIDMINKLPKDFMNEVEATYKERRNWKTVRLLDIQSTNKKIYKFDDKTDAYREAIDNV
jgi:hypothetical protein